MRTALRLREYESVLPPAEIYALVALTSFYCKYFAQCSKAFIRLQSLELPAHKKEAIDELALSIFTKFKPEDPGSRPHSCSNCGSSVKDYDGRCGGCGTAFPACVFSGRTILDQTEAAACKACKRRFFLTEARTKRNCGLCHTPLPERMLAIG
jgi:WD repeat-containing protein 35